MDYELTGKVKMIADAQTFDSGFVKREIVITVESGKYPQDISLECLADKVSMLDDLKEGDEVKAHFDIRGREYSGRYFNNLVCWNVKAAEGSASAPASDDVPPDDSEEPPIPF